MPWKAGTPGCCSCICNWTFTVTGCSQAVSGATINLRQSGSLIGTGTTDGSGHVTIDVPAGTYDIEVVPPDSRFDTYTSSGATHTCTQSTTITLTAASGYICPTGLCICASQAPLPDTVFLTGTDQDGNAVNDTCIYNSPPGGYPGTPPSGVWFGQTLHPSSPNYSVPYYYQVRCVDAIRVHWINSNTGISANFYVFSATAPGNSCSPFDFPNGSRALFGFGGTDWAVT